MTPNSRLEPTALRAAAQLPSEAVHRRWHHASEGEGKREESPKRRQHLLPQQTNRAHDQCVRHAGPVYAKLHVRDP
jgi:hypothetical protein